MKRMATLTLIGVSGKKYTFDVYPYGTIFEAIGAVYYISRRTEKADGTGSHDQIYIGETEDLSERFDNHHKKTCFKMYSANCINIYEESDEGKRPNIEKDLIDAYNPPCNG
ncbi:MAG: GIY-YIG nuclease family protein [Thermodesulfobacteriota bacterium]|nr:GIY-YIG nuclease family protein [Thermodesulfobacteriota bacterium]